MAKARAGGSDHKYLTKDELLDELSVKTADLEIADGKWIVVTGLTAKVGMTAFQSNPDDDPSDRMKRILMLGIVEPHFAEEDIELLADTQVMLAQKITEQIMTLSGLSLDEAESPAKAFLDEAPSPNPSSSTAPKS